MACLLSSASSRFRHAADPEIQALLSRLDAIQAALGLRDQEAHQVILTALNEHFQQRQ